MIVISNNYSFLKISLRWLALLLIILIPGCIIYCKMQPIILRYAESNAETIMLDSANEAVVRVFEKQDLKYDDIAVLSKNDKGNIISLEIDTLGINKIKSLVSNEISNIIAKKERYTVSIPIGTFFANSYTNGWGPDINFKMQMTSTALVDFENEFTSTGINQVLHRIIVKIKIKGSLIIAGYKKSITVNTSAIVAQTVIVGATPENFTNVIEGQNGSMADIINDYKAGE